jgi:hypothetical protein
MVFTTTSYETYVTTKGDNMSLEDRINLDGRQPVVIQPASSAGHNSEAVIIGRIKSTIDSLIKLEGEQEEALQVLVDNQEGEREKVLLVLGRQLFEGRKGKSNENYGKWVYNNFPNLLETVNAMEQAAILWAAEFPEQHQEMLDKNPRVRTTRGLHEKWKAHKKAKAAASGNNEGRGKGKPNNNTGGNSGKPDKPPQGDSDTKPNKGKGGINTTNPDTTTVKADATMIASSLIGVVTNVLLFEQTQGRDVEEPELSSAIFNEIRGQSADKMSDAEVEEFIEHKLKRVLSIITNSLPTMGGNVVNIQKAMENYK